MDHPAKELSDRPAAQDRRLPFPAAESRYSAGRRFRSELNTEQPQRNAKRFAFAGECNAASSYVVVFAENMILVRFVFLSHCVAICFSPLHAGKIYAA